MKPRGIGSLAVFMAASALCPAQAIYRMNPEQSGVSVHLSTSGLLKFAGHKHLIEAPIERGTIRYFAEAPEKSSVELEVSSRALRVIDRDADAKERAEIQRTMEGPEVLDVARFPRISFKSASTRRLGGERVELEGNLTLHGLTRPVRVAGIISSTGSRLQASGSCRFKQTDFGIKPVKAGGGTVSVKDEIQLSFRFTADLAR